MLNRYHASAFFAITLAACCDTETTNPAGTGGSDGGTIADSGVPGTCDPTVCPDVGECAVRGCDIYEGCVAVNLARYTPCSAGRCDGAGKCADICLLQADCSTPPDPSCAHSYCGDDACHVYNDPAGATCGAGGQCDENGSCVLPVPEH